MLDLWLHQHAWSSQRRRTAATQVLTDAADGLPRRLGRGQLAILPAILLARLAAVISHLL